jgi:rubrerythrin
VGHWLSKDAILSPFYDTSNMETSITTTTSLETSLLDKIMEELRGAPEERLAEFLSLLNRGMSAYNARAEGAGAGAGAGAAKKGPGRPKKAASAAPLAPLPDAEEDGEAPDASAYRLTPEEIKEGVCMARVIAESDKDKRWSIAIYRERQCGSALAEDAEDELCPTCARRAEAYSTAPKAGAWCGLVTEEPLSWMHMLGTAWATAKMEEGKLKWIGGDGAASVASAESTSSAGMSAAAVKAAAKAEKEAAKAAKLAEREAAKAEKEAAKLAKQAEKEAAKTAKLATKEVKPKAAPKAKKETTGAGAGAGAGAAAASAPAKADTGAEVTPTSGKLEFIGGDMYLIVGKKVYAYDMANEKKGDYVGKLGADRETIDGTVKEEDVEDEE